MAQNGSFTKGDFVFARLKGYSPWPAVINEVLNNNDKKTPSYTVTFFGDKTTAKINKKDLYSYHENLQLYGKEKTDNFKNKRLKNALKEADIAYRATCHQALLADNIDTAQSQDDQSPRESLCNLEDIEAKVKNQGNPDETDLETSLTLAAEIGNALLHENDNLKKRICDLKKQNGILETNLTNMEAKTEALLDEEEKYLNKIERLHEELEQTSQQLVKSKKAQLDLKRIFEEHDINQNEIFTQQLSKINELEEANVTLAKKLKHTQEINNPSRKPLSTKNSETQTYSELSLSTTSISPTLLKLDRIKEKQNDIEHALKTIVEQLKSKTPEHEPKPLATKTGHLKSNKPNVRSNKSLKNHSKQYQKRNYFSVSLQIAKSKLKSYETKPLTEYQIKLPGVSNKAIPEKPPTLSQTGGNSQTPTEKLPTPFLTEGNSQTPTQKLPTPSLTGGNSQTPTEKLPTLPQTGGNSQTPTEKLHTPFLTGGNSQTPTQKLPTPFLTGGNSQTPTEKPHTPFLTGGNSQTPTLKLPTLFLTGGNSQTPTEKLPKLSQTGGNSQTPTEKLLPPPQTGENSQTPTEKLPNHIQTRDFTQTLHDKRTQNAKVGTTALIYGRQTNPTKADLTDRVMQQSDDEDMEVTETRAPANKIIQNISINSNSGRISYLIQEDKESLENIKTFSFPPEETPLLTTQYLNDRDLPQTCGLLFYDMDSVSSNKPSNFPLQISTDTYHRLRNKKLSYNNFVASQDSHGNTHIIICYSSSQNNWKKKFFRFLEVANDCIKFPVLFSLKIEEIQKALEITQVNIREFLHVILQYSCNAYLHRLRIYTGDKKMKTIIDDILDNITDKAQRKVARISPNRDSPIYSAWRTTRGSLPQPNLYSPPRVSNMNKAGYMQGALQEQKHLWRVKENLILQDLSTKYKEFDISHIQDDNHKLQGFQRANKDKYAIINLKTGEFLTKHDTQKNYNFGYDGSRLVELTKDITQKYVAAPNNIYINNNVLVSDDTQLLNDLRLYNSIKNVDITAIPDLKIHLVQGVPGCGKTTFILNNYQHGDLILFPTRDSAQDFQRRFHELHPEEDRSIGRDTFRTLHSFMINSTHHIQKGNSYKRIIIDEALMMHAGEILFAAILAKTQEVLLVGDINQIPYINRTGISEVKFHNISEVAVITKELNITHRCTRSATAILAEYYPQGMMTTSDIEGEMKQQPFDTLESLQHTIEKNKHICLVFKQSEKRELIKLGFRTATIHEFQGRQAEDIVIVRTSTKPEDIYSSIPHCLVGITRHTRSFLYISPNTDDTLSNWIQKANSLNSQQLLNFSSDREAESSPLPKEDRIQNNFLSKIQLPKEKHKLQLKKKPLMFWNSLYKKIKNTQNPGKPNPLTKDSNSPLPTKI